MNPRFVSGHRLTILRMIPLAALLLWHSSVTMTLQAASPQILTELGSYHVEDAITVSFFGGPGNAKDKIAIYAKQTIPQWDAPTLWCYVDNTVYGNQGLGEGSVVFNPGISMPGDYTVYWLENDTATVLAQGDFYVSGAFQPHVAASKRVYAPNETIEITFVGGPGNAKDWIGLYPVEAAPGSQSSLRWLYLDGTTQGQAIKSDGTLTFPNGLAQPGNYKAHLLMNDGYSSLAAVVFSVSESVPLMARVVGVSPAATSAGNSPAIRYLATLADGTTKILSNSVVLKLDGSVVPHLYQVVGNRVEVSYQRDGLFAPGSQHTFWLSFRDDATPANTITNMAPFTVAQYRNVILPSPIYFEDFEQTSEGQLPSGWTALDYSDRDFASADLQFLNSASYAGWTVVSAERFGRGFGAYAHRAANNAQLKRIHQGNSANVLNGQPLPGSLAQGKILFANSAFRSGSQVQYLFSPEYDLAGKTNIHLSFHCLWEQKAYSMGAVEYSIDGGTNWLPVVYLLSEEATLWDTEDPETMCDADTIFWSENQDIATYRDPLTDELQGGSFQAFIAAPVSEALIPHISLRKVNDPNGSKRIECFRLAYADGKRVRLRFAHAGIDAWYFGIDNFGLYSIPTP